MSKITTRPNSYILGSKPQLEMYPRDFEDNFFIPVEARLSVKQPDGVIYTVSGAELVVGSGYLYTLYKPETTGWYEYEAWVLDGAGREAAETNGFEILDRLY